VEGTDFELFFETNDTLCLQDEYVISLEVLDGTWNGTSSSLFMHQYGGQLRFESLSDCKLNITGERYGKKEGVIKVSGCPFSNNIASIKNGNIPIITWDYGFYYPNYVAMILGICGLIGIMFTPYYFVKKFREGEYSNAMGYGLLIFVISIGLIVFWLWG